MLISAEGNNKTELLYFSNFKNNLNYVIKPAKSNYTDPVNMVKNLIKDTYKDDFDFKRGDIAFCVFDTDTSNSKQVEIDYAMREAKGKVKIVISNPCFEVWFLCHYSYSTRPYGTNEDVLRELRKEIDSYEKNKNIFNFIKEKTVYAIQNAMRLEEHHKSLGRKGKSMACNPSTEVYKIVEKLI